MNVTINSITAAYAKEMNCSELEALVKIGNCKFECDSLNQNGKEINFVDFTIDDRINLITLEGK